MTTVALVLGWTWVDGGARLRCWTDDGALQSLPLIDRLSLRILPGRHCTGYHDGQRLRPCPSGASVARGSRCRACTSRDAFRPCMTCTGFRCPPLPQAMLSYCRGDHHLYLACFGDELLKVGTASHPRRHQRIIEQGPLAAARVASAPGPQIKQMEHLLVQEGFTETMRRARKSALLQSAMTASEALERVLQATETLPGLLPERYHPHLHPPELVPQPELARRSRALPVNPLHLEDDRVVEGQIAGAVGHLVFLDDGDGCFTLDLGALRARWIELDPRGPRRRAEAQLGLF
ncbi:MAG TPA: DUF2797 domain-containing protein [Deltaproteobacteria bacterium]|nr:DUF2797 domain-containing protein [Deltaproteobacteria bacterium]